MTEAARRPATVSGENLVDYALRLCRERRDAYRAAPHDVEEHANVELTVLAGGYAYRQVAELVQNAADAIVEAGRTGEVGRIVVRADGAGLWAANTGAPVDAAGVRALLNANASGKRAGQIGRFGLGFKSLLKLGGRISVLSRSVSLLFNPEACRREIRDLLALPADTPAPGLRLATPQTWEQGVGSEPGAGVFDWATTIVFSELVSDGAREAIVDEMRRFPAEFLLFLPTDVELVLEANDLSRHLRRRTEENGTVVIEDAGAKGAAPQRWRVFETSVRITDAAALSDATTVHARDAVPLIWAAPVGSAQVAAGRFFAFFPTTTETRTLGILNAPWKLNSDRTALIPGDWNSALMKAAAAFIVEKMPELARDDDPGTLLDAYPRELPTQTDPAAPLVNALWERLLEKPLLPNCDLDLADARDLARPPHDSLEVGRLWMQLADSDLCRLLVHPMCSSSPQRIARLGQLAERLAEAGDEDRPRLARADAQKWLEAAAATEPDGAAETLGLADAYAAAVPGLYWDLTRDRVRIILGADGSLLTAAEASLGELPEPPLKSVHPTLAASPAALRILQKRFQVSGGETGTNWERLLTERVRLAEQRSEWGDVWNVLRRMPWDVFDEIVDWHEIRVRCLGGWSEVKRCLLPGDLVQPRDVDEADADCRDELQKWIVDHSYHAADTALLERLGVVAVPDPTDGWDEFWLDEFKGSTAGTWLEGWKERWLKDYWAELNYRPDRYLLGPSAFHMPRSWELMLLLPDAGRARLSRHLVEVAAAATAAELSTVTFRHSTRPSTWASHAYPHPLWLLLLEHGALAGSAGDIEFSSLLVADVAERAALVPALQPLAAGLGALQGSAGVWSTAGDAGEIWSDWLAFAAAEPAPTEALAGLWNAAGRTGAVPEAVCTPDGPRPIGEVLLAPSEADARTAREAGQICITLDHAVAELWLDHGARRLDSVAGLEGLDCERSDPLLLLELEPGIAEAIRAEAAPDAAVSFVPALARVISGVRQDLAWAIHDGTLLVSQTSYRSLGWADRLRLLLEGATACGWSRDDVDIDDLLDSGVATRRQSVSEAPDLPARLLAAIGEAGILLELFDEEVRARLERDPLKAARVAITLLGPALLAEPLIREAMEREGLQPPERWGSESAAAFVAAIGFPPEFAAAPGRRREPELLVGGPSPLKPLHDYQETVMRSLDRILKPGPDVRRRMVISLPTGAGKTRVAAQAAVERALGENSPNRLVLWIAQTDELCEQAVQCFRELWANLGARGESLRIIRFWGGQVNPQASEPDEPTVIVGTIQTVNARISNPEIDWLRRPGLVVIDECHHALTPTYTTLFRWLSSGPSRLEPPIIGLSATPFRGRNEDETAQLARRFDGRLIPADQAGLFDELQRRRILARFEYTRLDMETPFELTAEEERHLATFKVLPESAMERLGRNSERNDRIVEAMARSSEKSALVFATSVDHARRLAARLNVLGIPAAAVSGETDRSSRRWFIGAFQRGDVRVLCNHSALTTGFDAPSTDLIVIARPVFSPSLYMQMVGRGLRGPLNGGKEVCRVLTVQDNLDRYSDDLAHHYFERFYVQPDRAAVNPRSPEYAG